jgi:PAS domain S-box-containing protein
VSLPESISAADIDSLLAGAFDQARVGLALTDQNGTILRINSEITRMFGLRSEDIVGRNYLVLVPQRIRRAAIRANRSVIAGKPLAQPDWSVRLRDGRQIWVRVTPSLIERDGRKYVLSVLDDVTEPRQTAEEAQRLHAEVEALNVALEEKVRQRTTELRDALAEMEAFTYSISHDLRAPLRAMVGSSAILAQDHANELSMEAKSELQSIRRAANKLADLIDDLLHYSRLSRVQVRKEPVNVSAIAREIVESLSPHHAEIEIEAGLETRADETMIRFALQNLLDNAFKYSGSRAKPRVRFGRAITARGTAFFVQDNGIGFEEQYSHKLFQPFERLHRESDYPGTGIGLANVKRIVERHGGEVWAEGKPDEGATFFFTLP